MQVNFHRIATPLFALLTFMGCGKSSESPVHSITQLSNIHPEFLLLGKKIDGGAERCVYAVQVNNAELACQQHTCNTQAFYWPVQAVENGQRALLVNNCSSAPLSSAGQLLTNKGPTGDSGILIFQQGREGEGLWRNLELQNGDYGLQLATEAAEGVLTLENGTYSWTENPD
ncbi:MAG TPA: hypothetical protein VFV39_07225 [Limnobacter sp.]|nr:hypothetical protein [Limnobacter sp.]